MNLEENQKHCGFKLLVWEGGGSSVVSYRVGRSVVSKLPCSHVGESSCVGHVLCHQDVRHLVTGAYRAGGVWKLGGAEGSLGVWLSHRNKVPLIWSEWRVMSNKS